MFYSDISIFKHQFLKLISLKNKIFTREKEREKKTLNAVLFRNAHKFNQQMFESLILVKSLSLSKCTNLNIINVFFLIFFLFDEIAGSLRFSILYE